MSFTVCIIAVLPSQPRDMHTVRPIMSYLEGYLDTLYLGNVLFR
jgi:hypothetical protein